jgi:CheY-like chemotaxis protein
VEHGNKILLVDDEPSVRGAVSMMLGIDGHKVTEAGNAAEALSLFTQDQFDLVITDLMMPDMRGNELAIKLRLLAPSTPILMITAYPQQLGDAENPVDYILCKPFRLLELRESVAKVLKLPGRVMIRAEQPQRARW